MKTREEMIDRLVDDDIDTVRNDLNNDDAGFLNAILRGEGWVPYSQLTDEQVLVEYNEREFPEDQG